MEQTVCQKVRSVPLETQKKLGLFLTRRQRKDELFVCLFVFVSLGGLETLSFVHVGVNVTQAILLCFLWSQTM